MANGFDPNRSGTTPPAPSSLRRRAGASPTAWAGHWTLVQVGPFAGLSACLSAWLSAWLPVTLAACHPCVVPSGQSAETKRSGCGAVLIA